ncbi:MAG: EpsG family protein [Oscillospiraceae bacterium]
MAVYYINFVLILGLAWPLCIHKPTKAKKIAYLAITFGYMWFLATFREGIGYDYQSYIDIFNNAKAANSFMELWNMPHEIGFMLLTKGMTFITDSSVVMYGIYSALIFIPICIFIYKYCDDAWLATWLYVTLVFFYSNMSFIRQGLACAIIALAYGFLKNKKVVPFMLMVLLAAGFHKTALIMIPIFFLCHIKPNKWTSIFYAVSTGLVYIFLPQIVDLVTRFAFTSYRDSDGPYIKAGLSFVEFMLVPLVILITCIALYFVWRKRDPDAPMLLNLMTYSAIIWLAGTRFMILERFSMYNYIFALVALPAALRSLYASPETVEKRDKQAAYIAARKGKVPKQEAAKLDELELTIDDHKKYYWSAVIAVLVITFIYNYFGMYVNGFHNVFPYQSVFQWINTP